MKPEEAHQSYQVYALSLIQQSKSTFEILTFQSVAFGDFDSTCFSLRFSFRNSFLVLDELIP